MVKKAKKHKKNNIKVEKANLKNLKKYQNKFDTCFAINSILAKDIKSINKIISEIYKTLKPGGKLYAVLPSMESYLYQFMLIMDKEIENGASQKTAKKKALDPFYDDDFDFVQGLTNFQKETQKSLYRFEIRYRFSKQGFKNIKIQRVNYKWKAWKEAGHFYFPKEEPPWDWYLTCEKPRTTN